MEVEGTRLRRRSRAHNRVATALRGGDPPLLLGGAAALGWCWGGRARWCRGLGWRGGGRRAGAAALAGAGADDALVPRPWLALGRTTRWCRGLGWRLRRIGVRSAPRERGSVGLSRRRDVSWMRGPCSPLYAVAARPKVGAGGRWAAQPFICGGCSAQRRRRPWVGRAALHMRWLLGPRSATTGEASTPRGRRAPPGQHQERCPRPSGEGGSGTTPRQIMAH